MHRHSFVFAEDGDYIVLESFVFFENGATWIEHTRWLIPGTQIED